MLDHRPIRLSDDPDLVARVHELHREAWPVFLRAGHHAGERHWNRLFSDFARYQFALRDRAGGVVAAGHALPLALDDPTADLPDGWEAALEQGIADRAGGRQPTELCALAIVVAGTHRERGLSADAIRAMRALAAEDGLPVLIAPVRPTRKELYPLTPMERYAAWRREDNAPFDPWLRAHWRLGARIVGVAPRSMVVTGTVGEWEEWAAMPFPESGEYVVPGALAPVQIDRERNQGAYVEPNVWMRHIP